MARKHTRFLPTSIVRRDGELWIEQDAGEWRAAFRCLRRANRALTIAEVRIFPKAGAIGPRAGEWDVSAAVVPRGGLVARTLRAFEVGAARRAGLVEFPQFVARVLGDQKMRGHCAEPGLRRLHGAVAPPPEPQKPAPKRSGRPSLPDLRLAAAAYFYDKARDGRQQAHVAQKLRLTAGTAGSWIFKARQRGFLEPADGTHAGRGLTLKTTQLLAPFMDRSTKTLDLRRLLRAEN